MPNTALQIEGQARILLLDADAGRARLLLSTFSEAGLDCRYCPMGASSLPACRDAHPHVVVLDESVSGSDAEALCYTLRKAGAFPIVVLTATDDPAGAHRYQHIAAHSLPRSSHPRRVLGIIEALLHSVYSYDAVLPVEDIPSNVKPAPPRGWGRCEACNYMGPRAKFDCHDRSSAHSLTCPACKVSGNVTFSVL